MRAINPGFIRRIGDMKSWDAAFDEPMSKEDVLKANAAKIRAAF